MQDRVAVAFPCKVVLSISTYEGNFSLIILAHYVMSVRTLFLLFSIAMFLPFDSMSQTPRDTVYELTPIVISATRQPESVLEVPMAVTVVPPRVFQHTRQAGLDEALSMTPGVFAQSRAGGQDVRITIRGYGARGNGDRSNAGNMRGIRLIVDGFPITEPDGRTSLDLIDMTSVEKIEVVRSNSSALYGGASGGVVEISSVKSFHAPFLRAGSVLGSFGLRSHSIQTGMSVGTGTLLISANTMTFDGWRGHSGSSRTLINTVLQAPIGSQTSFSATATGTSNLFRFPGALTRDAYERDPREPDSTYLGRDERRFNRQGRLGIRLDHSLDEHQGIIVLGFLEPKILQRSERNSFRDFNRYHIGGSGQYRLATAMNENTRLQMMVGIDEAYQDGTILFYSLSGGNRGTTLKQNKQEGANTFGAFIQTEINLEEVWSFVAGGRYDILSYRADDFINPRLAATTSFSSFTPKLAVSFRVTPTHSIYASFGGGVEVPAFNEIDPPPELDTLTALNPFLDPMRSRTIELGGKGFLTANSSFLSSITYDLALYYITVTNDIIPYNGGAYFFTAGTSERVGLEATASIESRYGVSFTGSMTASDNTYREYRNDLGDFSGKKVAGLPQIVYNALLRYQMPGGVYSEAGVQYVGRYFGDDLNTVAAPSSTLYRARIGGRFSVGPMVVDAFFGMNNIADTKHIASMFINGVRGRYFEPGLPRNLVGGLNVKWEMVPN
jgi:iron complex outermembrane recepter protein